MATNRSATDLSNLPAAPVAEAALLTPAGRGAIATLRVTGTIDRIDHADPPLFQAVNGRPLRDQPLRRIVFGRWGREPAEEVVVCRLDPEVLEIHCHSGSAAVQRILDSLAAIGIPTSSWQSQHAHSAGILATEFLEALSQARTLRAAGILLGQQQGIFRQGIERVLRSALLNNDESLATVTRQLDEILGWAAFGLHLTRPWKVVLTGRPNVGKSSLVNALLGYSRAIVSPEPGTTRDVVTGETAFDGWLVELSDTAGIRDSAEEIEAAGITRAHDQARRADALLVILDASQPPDDEDFALLRRHPGALVVAHKADLPDVWRMTIPAGALRVSSQTGEGVDALATALVGRLVPRVPPADGAIPVTTRQIELLEAARTAADQGDCTRLLARLADLCGDR